MHVIGGCCGLEGDRASPAHENAEVLCLRVPADDALRGLENNLIGPVLGYVNRLREVIRRASLQEGYLSAFGRRRVPIGEAAVVSRQASPADESPIAIEAAVGAEGPGARGGVLKSARAERRRLETEALHDDVAIRRDGGRRQRGAASIDRARQVLRNRGRGVRGS